MSLYYPERKSWVKFASNRPIEAEALRLQLREHAVQVTGHRRVRRRSLAAPAACSSRTASRCRRRAGRSPGPVLEDVWDTIERGVVEATCIGTSHATLGRRLRSRAGRGLARRRRRRSATARSSKRAKRCARKTRTASPQRARRPRPTAIRSRCGPSTGSSTTASPSCSRTTSKRSMPAGAAATSKTGLRNDWLLELGKRRDWRNFAIDYPALSHERRPRGHVLRDACRASRTAKRARRGARRLDGATRRRRRLLAPRGRRCLRPSN